MRTRALRVTIGAYDHGAWHTAVVQDTFERGVLINSECIMMRWGTLSAVRANMLEAVDMLIKDETERITTAPAGGGSRAG